MNGGLPKEKAYESSIVSILKEIGGKLKAEEKTFRVFTDFFRVFGNLFQHTTEYLYSIEDYKQWIPETSYSSKTAIDALSEEFNRFAGDIMSINDELKKDVIGKLDIHEKSFTQTFKHCMKQEENIMNTLTVNKNSIEKIKENYMRNAKALEETQKSLRDFVEKGADCSPGVYERVIKRKTTQVIEKKQQTEQSLESYKRHLDLYNKLVNDKYYETEQLAKKLLKLDEDRIIAIKGLLDLHIKLIKKIGNIYISRAESMENTVECINCRNDIELFISETKMQSINVLLLPLEFEKYKYKDSSLEIIELQSDIEDAKEMRMAFGKLMNNKPLSIEEKASLIQYLHNNDGREILTEMLSKIKQKTFVPSLASFKDIGDLINIQLNAYLIEQVYDKNALQIILTVSGKIYTKIGTKTQFLYSLIGDNAFWADIGRWCDVIDYIIQQNIRITENKLKKRHSTNNFRHNVLDQTEANRNGFSDVFFSPKVLSAETKQITASNAFDVLGQFTIHFVNFNIKPEEAKKVIRSYGKFYKLEIEKIRELELNFVHYMPLELSKSARTKNRVRKMNAYTSDVNISISLAAKYLYKKVDLLNVLLLSKRTYEAVKIDVLKQVLNTFDMPITTRSKIWSSILDINEYEGKYNEVLARMRKGTLHLPKSLEDLIDSDVQRAFADAGPSYTLAVKTVLRAYAYYNKEVGYCQGMHSVAGFLLYFFKDEASTFKVLVQIFNRFEMSTFFTKDMLALKRCFFQLDRLLFHYYPFVAEHLRNEGIEAYLYSPTWFLTFFTGVMNYSKEIKAPPGLIAVWDSFIIDSWKTIFKTWLFIFSQLQDKLLHAKFEELMKLLGDLGNCTVFHSETSKLREALCKKSVTRRMLQTIEEEYDELAQGQREEDIEEEFPDASFKRNTVIK